MKQFSFLIALFVYLVQMSFSQSILVPNWTKYEESDLTGSANHVEGWGVDVDSAGSVYWVVSANHIGQGLDIIGHKYDENGNDIWTTPFVYGGPGNQHAYVCKIKDTCLYIGGKTCSGGQLSCDMLLLNVDNDTKGLNWFQTNGFSANGYDEVDGLEFLDDGIYCGGWSQEYESTIYENEIGLWKLDYSGTTEWTNYLGQAGTAEHQDGHFVVDENYIYAAGLWGGTGFANLLNGHSFLGKFSLSDGAFVDSTLFGTQSNFSDFENALSMTSDGEFLYITGYTTLPSTNNVQLFVTKYDKNLNQIWYFDWGGSQTENARGIAVKDDIIYISGWTESASHLTGGVKDLVYLKADTSGTVLSYQTWGGPEKDAPHDIVLHDDHVYITGTTTNASTGRKSAFLLAMNEETNNLNSIDANLFGFNFVPNPTNEEIHIQFNSELKEDALLSVIDGTGKVSVNSKIPSGTSNYNLKLQHPGVYSVLIESGELRIVKKVVVL